MTELLSCHLDALRGTLRRIGSLKAESKRPIPQELANLEHAIVAAFVRYRVELTNKAAGTFVAVLEHVYHEIGDSNRDARTAARRLVKGLRRT